MKIRIEWLLDSNDCEQCGGGYAEGGRVLIDSRVVVECLPRATCYGGTETYDHEEILKRMFAWLGHEYEEVNI